MKLILTILTMVILLIASYFLGNFITNGFNDLLLEQVFHTFLGFVLIVIVFLVGYIAYTLYDEII